MYLGWPRLQSWIVDKNCIFHRRCFNYAKDSVKKKLHPLQTRSALLTKKMCKNCLREVQKCHRGFIWTKLLQFDSVLLASCCNSIVLHTGLPPVVSDPSLNSTRQQPKSTLLADQLCHTTKISSSACATPLYNI